MKSSLLVKASGLEQSAEMEHDGCCFLKGDEQPPGGMR